MGEVIKESFQFLMKKPWKLLGISLMCSLLQILSSIFFGVIPGIAFGLTLIFSASMSIIYLKGLQGEDVQTKDLFVGFKDAHTAIKVACSIAWAHLWILIWGLIPIIGFIFSIIKSYQYRFVPYIIITKPETKATDALVLSTQKTKGHKATMFWTDVIINVVVSIVCSIVGSIASTFIKQTSLFSYHSNFVTSLVFWLLALICIIILIAIIVLAILFNGVVKASFYQKFGLQDNSGKIESEDNTKTSENNII